MFLQVVDLFWEAVESMQEEQRRQLLQFWTSLSTLPAGGPLPRPALPRPALPCCAVLCRAVPCRAVPCRAVPCRAVLCCAGHCSFSLRPLYSKNNQAVVYHAIDSL